MSLSLFRSISSQFEHIRSVNSVPMMNIISHQIETQVIEHNLPINFYAGFQRFSQFPAQLRLYSRLGAAARRVYVFGVPDVRPPAISGVEFIPIEPTSPLAKEWFVLVDSPEFWTVLLTREVEGRDVATGGRRFDGVWSFDTQVVERASLLMSQLMENDYTPIPHRNYEQQNIHIGEISGSLINKLDTAQVTKRRAWAQTTTVQAVINSALKAQDVSTLWQSTAEVLNSLFGAAGVVLLRTEDNNRLSIAAAAGDATMSGSVTKNDESPTGKALIQQAPIRVNDVRKTREREPLLPIAQSLIVVPIVGQQRTHGAILVGSQETDQWTEMDETTLAAIGNILAILLEARNESQAVSSPDQVDASAAQQMKAIIAHMLLLHRTLRGDIALTPTQQEIVTQMDRLTVNLAQRLSRAQLMPSN